jgi:voltage-gated potassium channel
MGYALSFYGIVDLLAVLPTYLSLLFPGGQYLIVIRILRVLRVFRVLKLAQYVGEARTLGMALRASRFKITVFLFTVLTIVVVVGSLLFLIEGPAAGFTSIPRGVYWAIVTLTTVGYGDIAPLTPLGQTLASFVMILGYGIIAVPTGIVTVELAHQAQRQTSFLVCATCGATGHEGDAKHCKHCGSILVMGNDTPGRA